MSYEYRMTVLEVSRHENPFYQVIRLQVEDLWTHASWDLSVGHYDDLLEALGRRERPTTLRTWESARSHPRFEPRKPADGTALLYDRRRLESGNYDRYALGPLGSGDSFLLWTDREPPAPAPPAPRRPDRSELP